MQEVGGAWGLEGGFQSHSSEDTWGRLRRQDTTGGGQVGGPGAWPELEMRWEGRSLSDQVGEVRQALWCPGCRGGEQVGSQVRISLP